MPVAQAVEVLAVETRVNVALSPKLTFQLYAQPLLSSGDDLTYKQLAQAESFDFDVFTEGVAGNGVTGWSCVGGQTCKDPEDTRFVDFDRDGQPDVAFPERDFNVRSLRLNAVARWEYRGGFHAVPGLAAGPRARGDHGNGVAGARSAGPVGGPHRKRVHRQADVLVRAVSGAGDAGLDERPARGPSS